MSRKLLYINNALVDLYPNTVIAQTLQAFDVGELGSVRANYTNRIKIPKTGTNRRALEFSDDTKSSTAFPYTSHSARYIENGLEIIRNGVVDLKETADAFELNIYSGPIGFFDFIKTKKLWDLGFTDINTAWNNTIRDGIRNATTGMVAPLLDDGIIVWNGVLPGIEHNQDSAKKVPWVYYHTIIDKIFATAGYKKEGAIFSDEAYLKLAMPLTVSYSPKFIKAKGFSASAPGNQAIVTTAAYTKLTFNTVAYNGSDGFYNGVDTYLINNPDTSLVYFSVLLRATVTITVANGTVELVLLRNNGATQQTLTVLTGGSGTYYLRAIGIARHGDEFTVKVRTDTGTPDVTVNYGVFDAEAQAPIRPEYAYFNHLFPDINQIDFLKDFSVRFNVKMIERNGVIVCKTMNEIIDDRSNALDWTKKQISGTQETRYNFNGLARSNFFNYQADEYTSELSEGHGQGVFTIANENLSEDQVIHDSMFAMSDMESFNQDIFMAKIAAGATKTTLGIRLLYLRQNATTDPEVYWDATARRDYKVAYFIDPNYIYSMHWRHFIDTYYTKFVAKLQKAKVVTRKYMLSEVDIHSFDQLKPVYDSGDYFIVTKISNFIPGQLTEVELFKIS
jgi:hypothetical protein